VWASRARYAAAALILPTNGCKPDRVRGPCSLHDRKSDGITAIVSLHQLDFARRYSDRIVGLAQGAVVFDGGRRLGKREVAKFMALGRRRRRRS
jgi:ABC-type polar amino acid transport system ATPase subunit